MPTYTPPTKDQQFLLHDVLKISASDIPGYDELDRDFTAAILEEAGKIAANVLQPLNTVGDTDMISRLPPKAPTGMPPPMTLPSVVRSGLMP